jgi:hypothetical protein
VAIVDKTIPKGIRFGEVWKKCAVDRPSEAMVSATPSAGFHRCDACFFVLNDSEWTTATMELRMAEIDTPIADINTI